LKHLVLGGMLPCAGDVAVKIASYALQGQQPFCEVYISSYHVCPTVAELGDYENDEQVQNYIDEYQILPPVNS